MLYIKANQKIEKILRLTAIFLFGIILPIYICPQLIQSYYAYFVAMKSSEVAFQLPRPGS